MRTEYIVAYDISDPDRLRKVFKVMRGFGDHMQYSVFRCALTRVERVRLQESLSKVIHHTEDQVLFVHLGPRTVATRRRYSTLGRVLSHPVRYAVVI